MTASDIFVLASCVAFTVLMLWWMRHAPTPVQLLLRLFTVRGRAIEAVDAQPRDAYVVDEELISDVEQIMDGPEGRKYRTQLDFDAWEAECACRPRIAKYTAQLKERSR